jgi:glycosidase
MSRHKKTTTKEVIMSQNKLTLCALTAAVIAIAGCEQPSSIDGDNTAPRIQFETTTVQLNALETTQITFDVSDAEGNLVDVSVKNNPGWVYAGDGILEFSPTNPDAGDHSVTIVADDGIDTTETVLSFSISENNPLPALTDYRTRALEDEVFYFVMTDRFTDGDTTNNEGDVSDSLASGGYDKTRDGFYHGGDLQGLTEKLSYIEDLGVSSIWLTPILKNKAMQGDSAGYHGYWTLDFTSIDPHLGGDDGLKEFIAAAHERNMKVFFDIIVNHSADVIKYDECHNPDGSLLTGVTSCDYKSLAQVAAGDDYTPFVPVGEEIAKTPAWLNETQYYHNQGESTWAGENSLYGDFVGLDDIDTNNPEVVSNFIDVFKGIVRDFRPDGFRVDTVKHVNTKFWQEFTPAVIEYAQAEDTDGLGTDGGGIPNFTMFGEVYSSDPTVLSYYTTEAQIPSVLDFGFQSSITSTINNNGVVETDATHPLTELFESDDLYSDADSDASELLNFVGNHDMGRFASFLGDTLDWEDKSLAKVDLAHAAMYFSRGIPVIYYGAEQGFIGTGGDKESRQDMMPSEVTYYNATNVLGTDKTSADNNFDTDHPLYLKWRDYARVLREHETLRNGLQHIRTTDTSNAYALSRFNASTGEEYLIAFNFNPDRRKTVIVPALANTYTAVYGIESDITKDVADNLNIPVPASSLVILKATGISDMAAPTIASVEGPTDGSFVSGNLAFDVEITGADARDIPTYTLTLEQSLNSGTTWTTAAIDHDFPYSLYLNTADIADGSDVQVRVFAENINGDTDTSTVTTLTVDSRSPQVTLDYEAAAAGKRVAITFDNGSQINLPADTAVDFSWAVKSNALVTFYTPGAGNSITADQPVWITRDEVMANAVENGGTGELESTLFINTAGAVAGIDNDTGNPANEFDQSAAVAFASALNVRGSLNSWGVTPLTFTDGTYSADVTLPLGDIEYKFADSTWSSVNVGGPVSETGMVKGANPGNLNQTITTAGEYTFYLLLGDIDTNGSANEYIHIIEPLNE